MGWTAEEFGHNFHQKKRIFLFCTESRPALDPVQPRFAWVREVLSPGVKRLGRGAEHLPPSCAEVGNGGAVFIHSRIRDA